jgi:putative acetyltransferase
MDNSQITIRPIYDWDLVQLNQIRTREDVCMNILALPTETLKETKDYFFDNPHFIHTFVAVNQNKKEKDVIGYVRLLQYQEVRLHHRGKISIAIDPTYHQCGVGTKLLAKIIDYAKKWMRLEKLELTVLENNEKAIGLYKKFGFEIEGVFKKDTLVDGNYENVVFMSLML